MSRKFRTAESAAPCEECYWYRRRFLFFKWCGWEMSEYAMKQYSSLLQFGLLSSERSKFKGQTTKPCKDFRRKDEQNTTP